MANFRNVVYSFINKYGNLCYNSLDTAFA